MNDAIDSVRMWAKISWLAFATSILAVIILLAFPTTVSRLGITGSIFFLALVALGLCSAGFLFGALRSRAKYKGTIGTGTLELGGPVVVLLMIILLGKQYAPDTKTSLIVRLHGPNGLSDKILTGRVTVDLGGDRREKDVTSGEVQFNEIPQAVRAEQILVIPSVPDYMPKITNAVDFPADGVLYMEMDPVTYSSVLRGTLLSTHGLPIKAADVRIDDGAASGVTDGFGNFAITVPVKVGRTVKLVAVLNGKSIYSHEVTVPGPMTLTAENNPK
jgi:hypothetical protein